MQRLETKVVSDIHFPHARHPAHGQYLRAPPPAVPRGFVLSAAAAPGAPKDRRGRGIAFSSLRPPMLGAVKFPTEHTLVRSEYARASISRFVGSIPKLEPSRRLAGASSVRSRGKNRLPRRAPRGINPGVDARLGHDRPADRGREPRGQAAWIVDFLLLTAHDA